MAETQVQPIESTESYNSTTSSLPSSALQVLYFHAPWAAPCAQMSTVLSALASTYPAADPPKIAFLSINAEELPEVSEEHDVTAVPYIVLRRDGKTVETVSGTDAAKLRSAVEKHVSTGSSTNDTTSLPPAQTVTRPANQPAPEITEKDVDPTQPKTDAAGAPSKDLSAYAPTSEDPDTAPEYSSTTAPKLDSTTGNEQSKETLQDRIAALVKAAPAMLFMKGTPSAPQCGFSRQLVSILRENSVRYGFFNILADEEVRQALKEYADWPTYPQLWMGGELVGGLDIVREELESDPDFFGSYRVDAQRNKGGPAAAEAQAGPE